MEVPLELTDFRADHTWAASHQMDHVKRFARDLKAGKKVDPVVAVALPDHRHVRHHRRASPGNGLQEAGLAGADVDRSRGLQGHPRCRVPDAFVPGASGRRSQE